MLQTTIRLATLLSPALYETYNSIARYLGERLHLSTSLCTGQDLAAFTRGEVEIGFLCGLLYVHLSQASSCPVELLAAPVLLGERYQDAPRYFSDVIVRSASSYTSLEDLRGCAWAYNERASHSGYNLVAYSLLQRDLAPNYFGRTVETGSHVQSLRAVLGGQADAAALDSHLLDVMLDQQPELRERLRIVAMLGPSPIPPLVVAKRLSPGLKQNLREALFTMHRNPRAAHELAKGQIKRFAPVTDQDYDPIRAMFARVQRSAFAV